MQLVIIYAGNTRATCHLLQCCQPSWSFPISTPTAPTVPLADATVSPAFNLRLFFTLSNMNFVENCSLYSKNMVQFTQFYKEKWGLFRTSNIHSATADSAPSGRHRLSRVQPTSFFSHYSIWTLLRIAHFIRKIWFNSTSFIKMRPISYFLCPLGHRWQRP